MNCPVGVVTDFLCVDCFTKAFCDGLGQAVYFACPATTPYCNNDQCSTIRDPDNDYCEEQIRDQQSDCSSEGYFPDPDNCQQFFFCPDPKAVPTQLRATYACPANYVYDSVNFYCKKKATAKDCVTAACTKANTFITYPGNANYYGFCQSTTKLLMFKCPTGHTFNLANYACEFKCSAEGIFGGPTCRDYYICFKSGTQLLAAPYSCPSGYLYNATARACKVDALNECPPVV